MAIWKRPENQDTDTHREWVDAVLLNGVNLSVWEEEFIDSIDTQLKAGRRLSEKQAEILERIYAERTP